MSIYLDRVYELPINLKLDGADYDGEAIINFISNDGSSRTIVYPEQKLLDSARVFMMLKFKFIKIHLLKSAKLQKNNA